ncbi:hypothetical protein BZG06_05485 [Salinivibrio kushneri]|uniref:EAL domain-containing protein n=1 Tax=Salinivibrio kushneri TaxID=1908198 RepID=A0AB36K5I4_9GAMM|nr:EAL domain-containing protein [Salinivibrio kushneri]OOE43368.1 hypothetical protein BZG09_10910 [Salinivibrio kushneri]OOE46816.1 hypothetical protein BZG06_05485 [Salinivibrio kushneri]
MTLYQRFLLVVSTAAVITLAVATAVVFHFGVQKIDREQQQHTRLLSQVLAEALPEVLLQGDTQRLNKLVSRVITMPQVERIVVKPMLSGDRQVWESDSPVLDAPRWFKQFAELTTRTRSVSVTDGRTQLAQLTIAISPQRHIEALWKRLLQLVLGVMTVIVLISLGASVMLLGAMAPVGELRKRLKALGHGDFHPARAKTRVNDLAALQSAFNFAGKQVVAVQRSQQDALARLREKLIVEPVSRLPNRAYFIYHLRSYIMDEYPCTLVIVEVDWLSHLRARNGYEYSERCWLQFGQTLTEVGLAQSHRLVARLSHNEIAILLMTDEESSVRHYLKQLLSTINKQLESLSLPVNQDYYLGLAKTCTDDDITSLFSRADNALKQAKCRGDTYIWPFDDQADSRTWEQWRQVVLDALSKKTLALYAHPVRHRDNQHNWHQEVYAHLWVDESWLAGGQLLSRISIYALGEEFDKHVLTRIDEYLKFHTISEKLAINLTLESVKSQAFHDWLQNFLLKTYLANKLTFEIAERTVYQCPETCQSLFRLIRVQGFEVGVDHFGRDMDNVDYIKYIEPDYVKLDSGFSQPSSDFEDVFIRMLVNIAASREIKVIATGIEQSEQHQYFHQLGCHGYQGYILPPIRLDSDHAHGGHERRD